MPFAALLEDTDNETVEWMMERMDGSSQYRHTQYIQIFNFAVAISMIDPNAGNFRY